MDGVEGSPEMSFEAFCHIAFETHFFSLFFEKKSRVFSIYRNSAVCTESQKSMKKFKKTIFSTLFKNDSGGLY